jgi:hypothetical protein
LKNFSIHHNILYNKYWKSGWLMIEQDCNRRFTIGGSRERVNMWSAAERPLHPCAYCTILTASPTWSTYLMIFSTLAPKYISSNCL